MTEASSTEPGIRNANDSGRFLVVKELFDALRWADERHERELWTISCASVGLCLAYLYDEPTTSERNKITVRWLRFIIRSRALSSASLFQVTI